MKTVEISLENARTAYNEAGGEIKKTLLNLIGRKILFDNIMDVVKSYEDACEVLGFIPLTIGHFDFLPDQDREYHYYDHQMNVITRVLNEGWVPDYSNNDPKYYPVFWWDPNAAGGPGFSCSGYDCDRSHSSVGARRTYRTSDLAIYSGKQFIHIHQKIHTLQPK